MWYIKVYYKLVVENTCQYTYVIYFHCLMGKYSQIMKCRLKWKKKGQINLSIVINRNNFLEKKRKVTYNRLIENFGGDYSKNKSWVANMKSTNQFLLDIFFANTTEHFREVKRSTHISSQNHPFFTLYSNEIFFELILWWVVRINKGPFQGRS
jgi:hypothetical protein